MCQRKCNCKGSIPWALSPSGPWNPHTHCLSWRRTNCRYVCEYDYKQALRLLHGAFSRITLNLCQTKINWGLQPNFTPGALQRLNLAVTISCGPTYCSWITPTNCYQIFNRKLTLLTTQRQSGVLLSHEMRGAQVEVWGENVCLLLIPNAERSQGSLQSLSAGGALCLFSSLQSFLMNIEAQIKVCFCLITFRICFIVAD